MILSVIFIFSGAVSAATIDIHQGDSIQDAINIANDSDTIDLGSGTYYEHDVTVNKSITIKGPQIAINATPTAVVDSQGHGRVFYIPSGYNVTLEYILIQNGNSATNSSNPYGGGILNSGTLSLQTSNVKTNTAYGGGGIANWGTMTVTDSNINSNVETGGNGGGIDNWGTISLNDTNLYGNIANGYGGGIENDQGLMNINYSNIYLNLATVQGGGIDCSESNSYGIININNSNIYTNTAYTMGGGLNNNQNGIMNIDDSQIFNNIATKSSSNSGGGIYDYCGVINITDTSIYGNTANSGGGLYNMDGNISLDNSNIYGNNARNYGGGITNEEYDYAFVITNTNIYSNTALFGGGIDNLDGNLVIINSNLSSNSAAVYGGGVYNEVYGILNITDSNIINNTSLYTGIGSVVYNLGDSALNFNKIIGTGTLITNQGRTVDATNNWWGSNSNPSGEVSSNVNVSTWLVLKTTASPTGISPNGSSNITADLTHDQTGNYYDPTLGHVPDGIPVIFTSTLGTLSILSSNLINGSASTIFSAGNLPGVAQITSSIEGYINSTNVFIGSVSSLCD